MLDEELEVAALERLRRARDQSRHGVEGVGERRPFRNLQSLEIVVAEGDLGAAARQRLGEEPQEDGLAACPGGHRALDAGPEDQAGEQRRGLRRGLVGALEADPALLVQGREQRHLPALSVAVAEGGAEVLERTASPGWRHAVQDFDAAQDLAGHDRVDADLAPRLDQVDLEEARHLDRDAQRLELAGDVAVARGGGAEAARVDRGQRPLGAGQTLRGGAGRRHLGELPQEARSALLARHREGQLREQDLVLDQVVEKGLGVLEGDLLLGVVGDQRRREVAEAGPVGGALESALQGVEGIDRHQVIGAKPAGQARFGVAQPPGRLVEAGVGAEEDLGAHLGAPDQVVAEREKVIHVQPAVAAVGRPLGEREPPALADRAGGAAGEEPEGRRPRGHAQEVAHQAVLAPLPLLAFRLALPLDEALHEVGRGEEDRLGDLRSLEERAQALAKERAVVGERLGQGGLVVVRRRRQQAGAPGLDIFEGEERRAQHDDARGRVVAVEAHRAPLPCERSITRSHAGSTSLTAASSASPTPAAPLRKLGSARQESPFTSSTIQFM